jgi:plastocyanin
VNSSLFVLNGSVGTVVCMKKTALALSLSLLLVACAGADDPNANDRGDATNDGASVEGEAAAGGGQQGAGRVDPRDGGLEVGMGEWAVTLESRVIRPGPVTFVIANNGTMGHGFEIEAEGNDSSGSGSGDGLKAETNLLQPGDTTRLTLDLAAGVHKVECFIEGHDDLGMEGFLEVREDAPLVRERVGRGQNDDTVAIAGFAFDPADLTVDRGTEITWTNEDQAPHTVSAEDGSFDSGTLEPGQTFSTTVDGAGRVTYMCQIHPEMRGTITVR